MRDCPRSFFEKDGREDGEGGGAGKRAAGSGFIGKILVQMIESKTVHLRSFVGFTIIPDLVDLACCETKPLSQSFGTGLAQEDPWEQANPEKCPFLQSLGALLPQSNNLNRV